MNNLASWIAIPRGYEKRNLRNLPFDVNPFIRQFKLMSPDFRSDSYPVISSFLYQTFRLACLQEKVLISRRFEDDLTLHNVLFNSRALSSSGNDIFIFFHEKPSNKGSGKTYFVWHFFDGGIKLGDLNFMSQFKVSCIAHTDYPLPAEIDPTGYISYFDLKTIKSLSIKSLNLEHIIKQGRVETRVPGAENLSHLQLIDTFVIAIERLKRELRANPQLGLPVLFNDHNSSESEIQTLLPLCLVNENGWYDCYLTVRNRKIHDLEGNEIVNLSVATILDRMMATKNARLLRSLNGTWLSSSFVKGKARADPVRKKEKDPKPAPTAGKVLTATLCDSVVTMNSAEDIIRKLEGHLHERDIGNFEIHLDKNSLTVTFDDIINSDLCIKKCHKRYFLGRKLFFN